MRTRSSPEEQTVQALDITQDGTTIESGSETPSQPWWLVLAVIAALVAGLGYGFVLGRGDRPDSRTEPIMAETTSPTSSPTTIISQSGFDVNPPTFRRSAPGHDLGTGVTEYLNLSRFSSIAVDSDGKVWAGGPAGIVRLNPASGDFTTFTGSGRTGPIDVQDIVAGPDGSVHAATTSGVSHWDGSEWGLDSVLVHLGMAPDESIREAGTLAVGHDGTLWLVTHEWTGWEVRSSLHYGQPPFTGSVPTISVDGYVRQLAVQPDGTIWAVIDDEIWHYDGAWTRVMRPRGWATTMASSTEGSLWVGRNTEIVRVGNGTEVEGTEVSWHDALGIERHDDWAPGFLQLMAVAPDDSVWALAEVWEPGPDWPADLDGPREVLLHIENGTVSEIAGPDTADHVSITDLAVAPDGDVWMAGDDGIRRFDGTDWHHFSLDHAPPIGSIDSMTAGWPGDLWLAGDTGVTRFIGGGWIRFAPEELNLGVPDWQLDGDVWVTSDGARVWAGIGCRVAEYRLVGWEPLPAVVEEPDECWHVAVTSSQGSPVVAVMRPWGGAADVYRWNGEQWDTAGWVDLEVSSIAAASDGTLWVAGWDGLGRLDQDGWDRLVSGQQFEHILVAGDGTVWATSGGPGSSGVWRWQDGRWEIDVEQEPFDHTTGAVALAAHPDGSVWALERTANGGFLVRNPAGVGRFVAEAGELHTMTIDWEGTIWVAGEGRLYRLAAAGAHPADLRPLNWTIDLDDAGPGIHTISMEVEVNGLTPAQISATSGRLFWAETGVELCAIGLGFDDVYVGVGDTFQTTEGCGADPTAMQDAFDSFGLPEDACIFVHLDSRTLTPPVSYCAPLSITGEPPP